jgi:hypothetical protein
VIEPISLRSDVAETTKMQPPKAGDVSASFDAAADASGHVSSDHYEIAGARVLMRCASAALREALTPAFAHLAVAADGNPAPPSLTVNLWDTASTGALPPPRPPTPEDYAPGALFYLQDGPVRAAYQPGVGSLSVFDSETGAAWHWVDDASDIPYWDRASPMRQILFWWLETRGYLQVHGGAVGLASGGVLLVGKGGSGKSTTALSSLGSKLLYAADDYVAVSIDSSPRIASLYNSGKVEPDHAQELLPHLLPLLSNGDRLEREKAVIYGHEHFPSQMTAGFPLSAVLVPMVRGTQRESRIVEIPRAAAFAALAPSTIVQLHTAGQDALGAMSRLIQRVPCYGIELGRDIGAIPCTIADYLERRASR